jgi:hypothetical protein
VGGCVGDELKRMGGRVEGKGGIWERMLNGEVWMRMCDWELNLFSSFLSF